MNRLQIRRRVQGLLRDDTFPVEAINEALNRVLLEISSSGRYRFQQATTTLAMVGGTYQYNIPTDLLGERLLVWKAGTDSQAVIAKFPEPIDEILSSGFVTSGDLPTTYLRWGNQFWFDPIPNATADGGLVTVYYFKDIATLDNDLTQITTLPARYQPTLLVYGVAADIAPGLMVRTPEGNMSIQIAFQRALKTMKEQELWDPHTDKQLIRDLRWKNINRVGNVGSVR